MARTLLVPVLPQVPTKGGAAVSDTPKTDAVKIRCGFQAVPEPMLQHARELERENATLREQVEHLIGMIEQLESDLAHFATIEAFETKKEAKP